ncbi:MAG: type II secretion system protein D [Phycisphaerales bacterium]|jgi:type II secretion system protein D
MTMRTYPSRIAQHTLARAVLSLALLTGVCYAQDTAAETPAPSLRFQFSEAPFSQVLDFVARQTGLPVIREAAVPAGTLTFISASEFTVPEAIEILNLNLAMHQVRLEQEAEFLYLRSTADAARKPTPVTDATNLDAMDRGEYVTVYIPLNNALASAVLPQLQQLVKEPGNILAVDSQNMLILVETAAQAKRIRELVNQIDAVKPASVDFHVYPLRHTQAPEMAVSLKALIPERDQLVTLDKNGQPKVYDDVSKAALMITADARLNAIVVVGPPQRLTTVEQLIAMLDVPEGTTGGQPPAMRTFELETVTPDEAAKQLNALFKGLSAQRRPTIQPLSQVGKIMIVGDAALVAQAEALLGELDPGLDRNPDDEDNAIVMRTIPLEHITPAEIDRLSRSLLSTRQTRLVRTAPLPGNQGLIAVGPSRDVEDVAQLIAAIDVAPEIRNEVQRVQINAQSPATVLEEASRLDALSDAAAEDPIKTILEADDRTLTLVGSRAAISRFTKLLLGVEKSTTVERTVRTYDVATGTATKLAGQLSRVLRPMLEPTDGTPYLAPKVEPLDELGSLIVHALPEQIEIVEGVLAQLQSERPGDRRLQVVSLPPYMTPDMVARVESLYAEQAPESAGAVQAELDSASGKLLITATSEGSRIFNDLLRQVQQLTPPSRTTKILEVQQVEAESIIEPLVTFLRTADPIEAGREIPEPTIVSDGRTNSLIITAEDAQHRLISDYVRRLDHIEPTDLPPLKLLQLRTADATAISQMLTQQYSRRPSSDRLARPVEVRSDGATNTLIVSAHADLFEEIKSFVDDLNKKQTEGPERVTVLYTLKVARAEDVAKAMNQLYPEPPVPLDRRGKPMVWLRQPKEVTVSAEPSSNSLIIDAIADRVDSIEELAERLDRVELPPVAELRTYHVVNADLNAVTRMLQGLARQGTLQGTAKSGAPQVQVVIEPEPVSSTLIVAGDEVTFAKVEQVLQSLEAIPFERSLRIVPIANAQATDIRERALMIYEAQIAQIEGANPVEVSIDDQSNSLEVVADADAMKRFMTILDQLQEQIGPARETRLIELQLAKVEEVIDFLRDLVTSSESMRLRGGPQPVFEPIEATNSVLVAATPAQFPIIEQLIRSIDAEQNTERPPLSILRLRSTDAASLASVLQRSYQQRPIEERSREPVDIQADAATNTLIVSAHPDVLPEIQGIVRELNDAQSLDAEGREIRIFPLKHARAEELAVTIDEMYPQPPMPTDSRGRPRPDLRQPREIVVRADRATNSLIVDAPARRLAGFEQIVESLDTANIATETELRTYTVTRADLNAAVTALRKLASSGALAATGQTPITIDSEPNSRTIIVSGPPAIFERIESVLHELDGADRAPSSLRMYQFGHARAERLEPLIRQLLASRLRELPGDAGTNKIEIAADRPSNTLIISAPEEIQEIASGLIESLDTEASVAGRNTVRVLPLMHAKAADVAKSITQAVPTLELPAGGPVSVIAAVGSNALILSGPQADLDKMEELIEPLDREPQDADAPQVRTFSLEHADAEAITVIVQRVLTVGEQDDILNMVPEWSRYQVIRDYARQGQKVGGTPVSVEANVRTNSVIVTAPPALLTIAEELIERLDQPSVEQDRSAVPFLPQRGEPARLASTVTKILEETTPDGRRPAELVVDENSGSILVMGRPDVVADAVRTLAAYDDRAPMIPPSRLSVFTLVNADAGVVSRTLQTMLADPARWPIDLRRASAAGLSVPKPVVTSDPKGNRVTVSAPETIMPLAAELVATLDRAAEGVSIGVRVFTLSEGDASPVAKAISQAMQASAKPGDPKPTITAEPNSNAVVVSGSQEQIQQAGDLISQMDNIGVEPGGVSVRTIFLNHARAEAIAPIIERILSEDDPLEGASPYVRVAIARDMARRGQALPGTTIRIEPESRLNALVVSAPQAQLDLAEQVIAGLDVPAGDKADARIVRVLTFLNADAGDLAQTLEAMFSEDELGGPPPKVRVDRGSNSLIVRATADQLKTIEELAASLESATLNTGRQLQTIPLDRSKVSAQDMAETIRRLLQQQGGVNVEVITTDELLADPEQPAKPTSRATPLLRIDQLIAIALPTNFSQPAEPEAEQPATPEPEATPPQDESPIKTTDLRIAVDPATNSLIVIGSPRLTERVAELAAQLESQMPAEPVGVRLVQLPESVDPRAVSQMITQTVRQIGQSTKANPGGFTSRVAVVPDVAGQALVVWANDTDFSTVRELIAGISRLGKSAELTVKVYPLANASATRAATAIRDLVAKAPTGRQARRVRELNLGVPDESGNIVRGAIDPSLVTVAVDPSQTAVIVTAPDAAFGLIDRFISLLDQSPVTERLAIKRYELAHAQATDLQRTLQTLFDAQRQGPGANEMARARFVADDRTNALLVTANADQHLQLNSILQTADASTARDDLELAIIPLQLASPRAVQQIVTQVIIGRDPAKKDEILISAQENSGVIVVRAPAKDLAEIREIVAQIDKAETDTFPIRSIKLERADAQEVARSLKQFFADRDRIQRQRGARRAGANAAIVGDRRSGTIVVSASDEDFAQVESLVAQFDAPAEAQELQFRIIPLEHVRVTDIRNTVQSISQQLQWERFTSRNQAQGGEGKVLVQVNDSSNSVVLFGQGELFDTIESIVKELDQPGSELDDTILKAVAAPGVDLRATAQTLQGLMATPGWRSWNGKDPDSVDVRIDQQRRLLMLVGKRPRVEEAVAYLDQILAGGGEQDVMQIVELETARAAELARALDLALPEGLQVRITPVSRTNSLLLTGPEADVAAVQQRITILDVAPDQAPIEFERFPLQHAQASEVSLSLRQLVRNRPRGDGEPAPSIDYMPDDNSLIVTATAEEMAFIQDMVSQLDVANQTERRTEFVKLEFADAEQTAEALKVFFGRYAPEAKTQAERSVSVVPDPASNSLVITADAGIWENITSLLAQLDTEEYDTSEQLVLIPLKHASATTVARALNEGFRAPLNNQLDRERVRLEAERRQQGNGRDNNFYQPTVLVQGDMVPTVSAEPQTNSLIVFAGRRELARIESIVKQLDLPDILRLPAPRIIPLSNGRASSIAQTLQQLFVDQANGAANSRRLLIFGDDSSNAIIVRAEDSQFEQIATLAKQLEQEAGHTQASPRIIRLSTIPAARLRTTLLGTFGPIAQSRRETLSIEIDRDSNSLVVASSDELFTQISSVAVQLDGAGLTPDDPGAAATPGSPARGLELVRVSNRDPQEVVQELVRLGLTRAQQGDRPGIVAEPVGLVPLREMGSVAVVASAADMVAVRSVIKALDEGSIEQSLAMRIVRLQLADAAQVANVVRSMLAPTSPTGAGAAPAIAEQVRRLNLLSGTSDRPVQIDLTSPIQLLPDPGTNAILVASSAENLDAIEAIIAQLDGTPAGSAVTVKIFPLRYASATRVRQVLLELFSQGTNLGRPAGTNRVGLPSTTVGRALASNVAFSINERSNAVIVAGPEESVALVEVLITDLDAENAEKTELIPLTDSIKAAEMASLIRELYLNRELARRGADAVDLVPNERLNALFVRGSDEDIERIKSLVLDLSDTNVGAVEEVRRVTLGSATAAEVVALLEDVLAGRTISGKQLGASATRLRVFTQNLPDFAAEATIDGSVRDQITLTPDRRTNSILIKATPAMVEFLTTIITDLDQETRGNRVIERFELVNADALQMQSVLVDLFSLTQRGNRYVLVPNPRGPQAEGDEAVDTRETFTAVPDERQELIVTIDRRTNMLLVSGTPDLIEEVRSLVTELDSIEAVERERLVVELKNADATEVQNTLAAYFEGEADIARATLGPQVSGSLLAQLEREVTIVGDPSSNKLVISASPRYVDAVTNIIEELDAAPPQVMIQVLIAEVTLDSLGQWGMDVNVGGVVVQSSINGSTITQSNIGGDNYSFGALAAGAGVATAFGVPNLAIASTDFGLLIRALQAQGKLEVLSRPQVQVANNQTASIQVGENVTVPVGTVQSGDLLRAETEQREVGIILEVTPTISSDGFVRMDISPEISSVSDRSTQIDENFEVPIITQRRLSTTVAVSDGQSVVIGGLIQTSESSRETKVPLLGDIPLIGGLFRTDSSEKIKTELLIILTPYVIPGEKGAAVIRMNELTERSLESMNDRSKVDQALQLDSFTEDPEMDGEEPTDED